MMNIEEKYVAAGCDYAALSERTFGDAVLINELFRLFISDDSWDEMKSCMDRGETENAFKAAHSLKGSCGMLGLSRLYEKMKLITDKLRFGDLDGAKDMFPQTSDEYENAVLLLKELIC